MSIRTGIEINHDFAAKHNGLDFVTALAWAVYHGNERDWDNLRREYGVQRVYRCHHSGDRIEAMKAEQGKTA
jgi:hypothetical protein